MMIIVVEGYFSDRALGTVTPRALSRKLIENRSTSFSFQFMITGLFEFFCWHRKNLLLNLVHRNFKIRYKGSTLGYLWTLVIPLSQVVVFYFVYEIILKVPVPHYLSFIVTGIIPWVFFSSTVSESLESLVSGQNLLTHMPMPLQSFPAAAVTTHFISFILSWPIIFGVLIFDGVGFHESMWVFVPLSLCFFVFTYSLSFILASLFVLFRDLKYIFSIILQLWMYFTPILYAQSMIPPQYKWILFANPITGYFVGVREVLIAGSLPQFNLLMIFWGWTAVTFVIANVMRVTIGPYLVEKI